MLRTSYGQNLHPRVICDIFYPGQWNLYTPIQAKSLLLRQQCTQEKTTVHIFFTLTPYLHPQTPIPKYDVFDLRLHIAPFHIVEYMTLDLIAGPFVYGKF